MSAVLNESQRWGGTIIRHAVVSLSFLLLYLLLNRPEVILFSRIGVVAWYPAIGLSMALMLGVSPWYALLVCFAGAFAGRVIYAQPVVSFSNTVGAAGIAICYGAAAYILRGPEQIDLGLRRRRDVVRYVLASGAAAVAATIIGVACLIADHSITWREYKSSALGWFLGDAIGLVGIAPFLLVHVLPHVRKWLSETPSNLQSARAHPLGTTFTFGTLAETFGQIVTILAVLWVMFGTKDGRYDHFYLCFIPIIWIAMRQGIRRAVTGLLAMNFGIVVAMHLFPPTVVLFAKVGLLMLVLSTVGLIVGSEVSERHRLAIDLNERTSYLDSLIENSPLGIVVLDRQGSVELANSAFEKLFQCDRRELASIDIGNTSLFDDEGTDAAQLIPQIFAGATLHRTVRQRRKDSQILDLAVHGVPLLLNGEVQGAYLIYEDISDQIRAAERLRLQATALEAVANAIVITDQKGTILWTNPAFGDLTGYTSEEALGKNQRLLSSGIQSKEFYANLWQTISTGKIWSGELTNRRKDGSFYTEEQTITPVCSDSGDVTHFVAVKHDITERRRAAQELCDREDKLRLILESTAEAIYGIDLEGRCTFCNPACLRLLGYKHSDELLGKNMHDLIHHSRSNERKLPEEECRIFRAFKTGQEIHVDDEVLWKADGTSFPAEYWSYPQRKGEDIVEAVVTFIDITERKAAEEQIRSLAYYDTLTGLPNRILLQDRLAQALAGASRHQDKVALLFLDLDHFKVINDSLGHSVGDLLLKQVAERLKQETREQDTVSRLGGDEFVVVLSGIRQIADSAVTAERIMNAMTSEFVIQGHSLNVGCSLGISIFPDDGRDGEILVKHADAAMYCAKENGRNDFQFFTQNMNANLVQQLTLENSMRLALQKKEFFLMYQPQLDLTTGEISGVEALIRWQDPKSGLVAPNDFIPIAENSGLIIPIGEWVLHTACAQARKWQDEGLPAVPVAVNVSAMQFRHRGFLELVRRVLHETGLPPPYLELELTESLILSNADLMLSKLKELKGMGVKLAIDDFGTGYSSFSYLRHFRVHKLKIDRSFVRDVCSDSDDAAITGAIISVAKSLNLKVIAEGVENKEQISFLREHNCDEIQGYYFSKPLSPDECAAKMGSTLHWLPPTYSDTGSDPILADAARAQ
jgi:diguanylate cyclase (GGDEF)-like protein/PAS domain S-box-containing protein